MDLQRLLMMIVKPILRRLITRGVDAGFNRFSGPADSADRQPKSKAVKGQPQARDAAQRLRQSMRIGRKLW